MQLAALQLQEVELRQALDEAKASVTARQQTKALSEWANRISDLPPNRYWMLLLQRIEMSCIISLQFIRVRFK